MPNANIPSECQTEENQIMEDHNSAIITRKKSNSSNNRGEDAPSSHSDVPSPTRFADHSSILAEIYSFIGTLTAVVAVGIVIVWAYVPEHWLEFIGIHYYPNRYLSLAVPSYVAVPIVVAIVLYTGLNFLATPPPTTLKTVFEEYSEDLLSVSGVPLTDDGEPVSDSELGIDGDNEMLNDLKSEFCYRLASSQEFSLSGES